MVKIADQIEHYLENFLSNKPRMNTTHLSKLTLLKGPYNKLDDGTDFEENIHGGFGNLIPIKLDIESDGQRLKEQFLWEKNEPYLSLEAFAKILIEE